MPSGSDGYAEDDAADGLLERGSMAFLTGARHGQIIQVCTPCGPPTQLLCGTLTGKGCAWCWPPGGDAAL